MKIQRILKRLLFGNVFRTANLNLQIVSAWELLSRIRRRSIRFEKSADDLFFSARIPQRTRRLFECLNATRRTQTISRNEILTRALLLSRDVSKREAIRSLREAAVLSVACGFPSRDWTGWSKRLQLSKRHAVHLTILETGE